jgi:SAM-dependent methyltransferase
MGYNEGMSAAMNRIPEPEHMDDAAQARAYALADFSEINELFVERLLEMKPEPGPVLALDAGTGPADIPRRLLSCRPEWHIVGLDTSWPMLELACTPPSPGVRPKLTCPHAEHAHPIRRHQRERGGLSLVRGNLRTAPLAAGAFDVLISNGVLHHLSNPLTFWSELRRVGRPGAVLFVRDLARPDTPDEARRLVETYAGAEPPELQDAFYRSLLAAYSFEEVHQQLAAAGLCHMTITRITDRHLDIYGTL